MVYVLLSALFFRILMDICFKFAVQDIEFKSMSSFLPTFKKVLSRPWLWLAGGVSGLNFILWVNACIPWS